MFWRLHLIGWIVYGAGTYLATLARITPDQFVPMLGLKLVRTALGFALSLVLHGLLHVLRRRRAAWGLLACVAVPVSLGLGVIWLAGYWAITATWRVADLPAVDWSTFPRAVLDHAFVLLTWAAVDIGFHEWRAREAAERRASDAAAGLRDAELSLLRYQLNPHFLFNALTTLRASMPLDADAARDTVDALSGFLRHALRASPVRMVPLAQEMEAASHFLAIQRLRYGARLEAQVELDPRIAHVDVPGFLLQPLVENAVTHGMRSEAVPLRVEVVASQRADGIHIDVINSNGVAPLTTPPMEGTTLAVPNAGVAPESGHRIGLSNVQERLRRHYGDAARFALEHRADQVIASIVIAERPA